MPLFFGPILSQRSLLRPHLSPVPPSLAANHYLVARGNHSHTCTPITVRDWLVNCEKLFISHSISEPTLSAQYFMLHCLYPSATSLSLLHRPRTLDTILDERQINQLKDLCAQRLTHLSVQHCIGSWDFHNISLAVRAPLLVPRPETEELVDHVITHIQQQNLTNQVNVLEVGTGSGCISLALCHALPRLTITAIDISREAVDLATENAT
eukprot:Ihof_evm10s295 gene=Ihof_evmTU10s295